MEKTVHVNSYVKRDGTQVREHYRTIDTTNSFAPNSGNDPVISGSNADLEVILNDIIKQIPNNIPSTIPQTSVPNKTLGNAMRLYTGISSGQVYENPQPPSSDDQPPTPTGGVFGKVIGFVIDMLPYAIEIYKAMNSGDGRAVELFQPKIDQNLKLLDTTVGQMKTNLDTSLQKLSRTTNQEDYEKLYAEFQNDYKNYQTASDIVAKVKAYADNNDYKSVAKELGDFVDYSENRTILSDLLNPDVKLQEIMKNTSNLINKLILDNKFNYAIKNNVSGVNYNADFSNSKNPNIMFNNIINRNKPNAQELANIYLAQPSKIPLSKEYIYIPKGNANTINIKYNLTGNKIIPQDWEGIVYNEYSSLSKNLSKSLEMQSQIRAQLNFMKAKTQNDKLEVNFTQDSNLHLSIGHATILEPYIDSAGYFHGILFDKYDFELLEYLKKHNYKDFLTYIANDYFFIIQLFKEHSFYILAPIIFKW